MKLKIFKVFSHLIRTVPYDHHLLQGEVTGHHLLHGRNIAGAHAVADHQRSVVHVHHVDDVVRLNKWEREGKEKKKSH